MGRVFPVMVVLGVLSESPFQMGRTGSDISGFGGVDDIGSQLW